ncbi:MAG: T9SS type A sorting domain-containing protein [Bacteroidota bacterium]
MSLSAKDAVLDWATLSEINSDYFIIERSPNGRNFQPIGKENARGNSQETSMYQYTDVDIANSSAKQVFYRLKQVDLDGSFSYSSVEELKLDGSSFSLTLAPNPAVDRVRVQYKQPRAQEQAFAVYSITGQKVYSGSLSETSGEIAIDVSSWPNGTYLVKAASRNDVLAKLIVQH